MAGMRETNYKFFRVMLGKAGIGDAGTEIYSIHSLGDTRVSSCHLALGLLRKTIWGWLDKQPHCDMGVMAVRESKLHITPYLSLFSL